MLFALGPLRRCSRLTRRHETSRECHQIHVRKLGILGSSMLSPSAKDEIIGVAPSQSLLLVSRDRWPSRSAHVPNRYAAGLQDVRIVTRHMDGTLNDGTTGAAGGCRPEARARHEVRSIERPREASACERSCSHSDLYQVAVRLVCLEPRMESAKAVTISTMVPLVWQETASVRRAEGM